MRVATCTHQPIQVLIVFASAHSRGLRRRLTPESKVHPLLCHSAFVRVATFQRVHVADNVDSLPQRIRAGCDSTFKIRCQESILCHSAFVRVATLYRIYKSVIKALCHSAFVRVATARPESNEYNVHLCHSAFVRVATISAWFFSNAHFFATAHSCGLRLGADSIHRLTRLFATAHSCGLRLFVNQPEAGRLIFATAHSCGLRPPSLDI